MKSTKRKKRRQKRILLFSGLILLLSLITAGGVFAAIKLANKETQLPATQQAEELLLQYMAHLEAGEYNAMYAMTTDFDSEEPSITEEDFVERNLRIYEGIAFANPEISNIEAVEYKDGDVSVSYEMSFSTIAGSVQFQYLMAFEPSEDGYKISWGDDLIFPNLKASDRITVSTIYAERGEITDRNGRLLAGKGTATSVGIIPGKLENREAAIQQMAALLNMTAESIESKLSASWVKEDLFVPITTLPKIREIDLINPEPESGISEEQLRQKQLLTIPGVILSDTEVRYYPLGESAAHLIGYVQNVTAEDLENHPNEGYTSNSVIGRNGMETLFESELRGRDGHTIRIVDANGESKEIIAFVAQENGQNIRLTIDSDLQRALYEQFRDEPGCSAAINPYTGEVLALVSTPSYDSNAFILGISQDQWTAWNEAVEQPLYNRFRQAWVPGSTIKPIIAAIGLDAGAYSSEEDFGTSGLSWQANDSWGSYYVTTLREYEPAVLKNALIYSDNIYFAKAALKIGVDNLTAALTALGFDQQIPFEILMSISQYSNTDNIETEVQLADSGYGQGQMLVNPLHMACIYTAFLNGGNIIKPYLQYQETPRNEVWLPQAFSSEAVNIVMEGLLGVINDPNGTARQAQRDDIVLAGKTGTAETKMDKSDTEGTEIGWFAVFTAEPNIERPILIVSMVENVKESGGSGYVVSKIKTVLDAYLQ